MSNSVQIVARKVSARFLQPNNLTQLTQHSLQRILPATSNALRTFRSATIGNHPSPSSSSQKPTSFPLIEPLHKNQFSSAAQTEQDSSSSSSSSTPSKRKKRTVQRKDPLIITPAAADRIQELLSSPNGQGAIGIRLGVKRRGCNGLSYTLNYAFEREANEEEMVAPSNGVRVMIEPMALFSVVGTQMDWVVTDMSSEFTFENPNSKGECGCGESFNV